MEFQKRIMGKASDDIDDSVPPLMVRMNRTVSDSGARSYQITVPALQAARKAFQLMTMIIVRKPSRAVSATRFWHWGFPRVYWFMPASENKAAGKGSRGFHDSGPRDTNFYPCVCSSVAPKAERYPQLEFSRIFLDDLVAGYEERDGWEGLSAFVTL